jgi:hypothetical protein
MSNVSIKDASKILGNALLQNLGKWWLSKMIARFGLARLRKAIGLCVVLVLGYAALRRLGMMRAVRVLYDNYLLKLWRAYLVHKQLKGAEVKVAVVREVPVNKIIEVGGRYYTRATAGGVIHEMRFRRYDGQTPVFEVVEEPRGESKEACLPGNFVTAPAMPLQYSMLLGFGSSESVTPLGVYTRIGETSYITAAHVHHATKEYLEGGGELFVGTLKGTTLEWRVLPKEVRYTEAEAHMPRCYRNDDPVITGYDVCVVTLCKSLGAALGLRVCKKVFSSALPTEVKMVGISNEGVITTASRVNREEGLRARKLAGHYCATWNGCSGMPIFNRDALVGLHVGYTQSPGCNCMITGRGIVEFLKSVRMEPVTFQHMQVKGGEGAEQQETATKEQRDAALQEAAVRDGASEKKEAVTVEQKIATMTQEERMELVAMAIAAIGDADSSGDAGQRGSGSSSSKDTHERKETAIQDVSIYDEKADDYLDPRAIEQTIDDTLGRGDEDHILDQPLTHRKTRVQRAIARGGDYGRFLSQWYSASDVDPHLREKYGDRYEAAKARVDALREGTIPPHIAEEAIKLPLKDIKHSGKHPLEAAIIQCFAQDTYAPFTEHIREHGQYKEPIWELPIFDDLRVFSRHVEELSEPAPSGAKRLGNGSGILPDKEARPITAEKLARAEELGLAHILGDGAKYWNPARGTKAVEHSLHAQLARRDAVKQTRFVTVEQALEKASHHPPMTYYTYASLRRCYAHAWMQVDLEKSAGWSGRLLGHNSKQSVWNDEKARDAITHAAMLRELLIMALEPEYIYNLGAETAYRAGIISPERLFVKQEPHAYKKVKEGRWRLIWASDLISELVQRVCWATTSAETVRHYSNGAGLRYPSWGQSAGLGHHDGGLQALLAQFKVLASIGRHKAVGWSDVKGWDMAFTPDLWKASAEILAHDMNVPSESGACGFSLSMGLKNMRIRGVCAMHNWHVVDTGRDLLALAQAGIMSSGILATFLVNSTARALLEYVYGVEHGVPHPAVLAAGDDLVTSIVLEGDEVGVYEKWYAEHGQVVTDHGHGRAEVEFTSHIFNLESDYKGVHYDNIEKMLAKVLLAEKISPEVMIGHRSALRHTAEAMQAYDALVARLLEDGLIKMVDHMPTDDDLGLSW